MQFRSNQIKDLTRKKQIHQNYNVKMTLEVSQGHNELVWSSPKARKRRTRP